MSDAIYPVLPGATLETTWTPMFRTKVQSAASGKEYRASLMANPLYNIELKYEFLRHSALPTSHLRQLIGFFMARRGAYESFLFRFDEDSSVTDQQVGVADGVTKAFQLQRSFGGGAGEPVQNIDAITDVKVNGLAAGAYTVSATGLLTFIVAPAAGPVTWSGSYFYRARFDADEMDVDRFLRNLWKGSVKLVATLGTRI
jgi:uncharacterized protein (TIGR02217 family)